MKSGIAPGVDGIACEMLKAGGASDPGLGSRESAYFWRLGVGSR